MLEWYVGITGESFDLENLSESFNSPDLFITKIEEGYILKSTDFNSLENVGDVDNKAKEILTQINGYAWLVLGTQRPLKLAYTARVKDDGKITRFKSLSGSVRVRGGGKIRISITTKGGEVQDQETFPADLIPKIISIAQNDENVATVLQILGDRLKDWVNLYNIFEVVKKDVREIPEEWASGNAISRFKQTANSVLAIGYDSRHVGKIFLPPPKPMTLSEAKSFIKNIINNWIQSKK